MYSKCLLSLILWILLTTQDALSELTLPKKTVCYSHLQTCIWPVEVKRNFSEQQRECARHDGIVLTIQDKAKEYFVNNTISREGWFNDTETYSKVIFIGYKDVFHHGIFYEVGPTAEPQRNITYLPDIPNNEETNCCILKTNPDGDIINVVNCTANYTAICSKEVTTRSECDIPNFLLLHESLCYWSIKDKGNASDQIIKCGNDGGSLAVIRQETTIRNLSATFSIGESNEVWIGINNLDREGEFRETYYLKESYFSAWDTGEPNLDSELCVERFQNGKWNDIPCEKKRPTICQKMFTPVRREVNSSRSPCHAEVRNVSIPTPEELEQRLTQIKKKLLLPKNGTSAYKRKKISPYENRPVAKGLGCIGIVVIVAVVSLLVMIDITSLLDRRSRRVAKK